MFKLNRTIAKFFVSLAVDCTVVGVLWIAMYLLFHR